MWLFSLIQWSCIELCQNIDHISFFHVSVKGYEMVIEFNITKINNIGEKIPPKHCYANPLDCTLCIFTSMVVYLSLLNLRGSDKNKYIMSIKPIARYVSASIWYTKCIKNWVKPFCCHTDHFVRPNHMDAYSNWKVGDTYAYLGTKSPSPISSIFIVANVYLV